MLVVIRFALAMVLAGAIVGSVRADYVGGLDPDGENFLSLRSGPGGGFPEIRRVGPRTPVQVLGTSGVWRQVRLGDGTVGWAYDQFIYPGDPPGTSRPAPAAPVAANQPQGLRPVGPIQRFDNGNIGAVVNGPTADTIFSTPTPVYLVSVTTYHWNFAHGRYPGTVALRGSDGTLHGPWKARGGVGQGGVRDAYWRTEPRIVLPAGAYRVVDSDRRTWSTNAAGQGRGFTIIEWQAVSGGETPPVAEAPSQPPPQPPPPQPPKANADIERLKLEAEIERLKLEQLKMRQGTTPAADTASPPKADTQTAETRPQPEPKAAQPKGGRQVALVIGNGAYQALTRLPTSANDARRMAAALTAAGYEVAVATDLGRSAMADRLAQFYAAARGANVALFYFSGHGLQVNGRNFLLPVDASFRDEGASLDIEARAIELQKFLNAASGARTTVAFVDACRDNPLLDESMAKTLYKGVGSTKGLAVVKREELSSGQFVGFAAEDGKTAQTGTGEVSTYTAALLRNLEEKGLDISVLHRRVRKQVEEETHGSQSPRAVDDLREEFTLIR